MSNLIRLLVFSVTFSVAAIDVRAVDDPVVIELKDRKVTTSEFNRSFEVAVRALASQQGVAYGDQSVAQIENLRQGYLSQRATEMVMLQEAERRGVTVLSEDIDTYVKAFYDNAGTQDIQKALQDAGFESEDHLRQVERERQIVRQLMAEITEEIVIRPGDVVVLHHDIQDELATPEQICLRHIVVENDFSARDLIKQLNDGADFALLASENSIDTHSSARGGDVGCFARETIIPTSDFERAAFNSKIGELAGPVQSQMGYHVLVVYERQPARVPTLNEVYEQLESELRHEELPKRLSALREESGIKIYPDKL